MRRLTQEPLAEPHVSQKHRDRVGGSQGRRRGQLPLHADRMGPDVDIAKLPDAEMTFVEPMLCEPVKTLPAGGKWLYEIKLDGYRSLAVISKAVKLLSRRNNALNTRFPSLVQAFAKLPHNTILDGEIVALDHEGRPSFNLLQHHQSRAAAIVYYAFDLLAYQGKSLHGLPLEQRQTMLRWVLREVGDPIRRSEPLTVAPEWLIAAARTHGLEGLIAKRKDSLYEPGQRGGAWAKYKMNRGQELVIGGYLPGTARLRRCWWGTMTMTGWCSWRKYTMALCPISNERSLSASGNWKRRSVRSPIYRSRRRPGGGWR
jgi:ATP-dependent DNA ligase